MTNHAELSRDLALALGWRISHTTASGEVHVCLRRGISRRFDYRDPTVCLPLIEWLISKHEAALSRGVGGEAFAIWFRPAQGLMRTTADTLPEAVARAVIAVKKG